MSFSKKIKKFTFLKEEAEAIAKSKAPAKIPIYNIKSETGDMWSRYNKDRIGKSYKEIRGQFTDPEIENLHGIFVRPKTDGSKPNHFIFSDNSPEDTSDLLKKFYKEDIPASNLIEIKKDDYKNVELPDILQVINQFSNYNIDGLTKIVYTKLTSLKEPLEKTNSVLDKALSHDDVDTLNKIFKELIQRNVINSFDTQGNPVKKSTILSNIEDESYVLKDIADTNKLNTSLKGEYENISKLISSIKNKTLNLYKKVKGTSNPEKLNKDINDSKNEQELKKTVEHIENLTDVIPEDEVEKLYQKVAVKEKSLGLPEGGIRDKRFLNIYDKILIMIRKYKESPHDNMDDLQRDHSSIINQIKNITTQVRKKEEVNILSDIKQYLTKILETKAGLIKAREDLKITDTETEGEIVSDSPKMEEGVNIKINAYVLKAEVGLPLGKPITLDSSMWNMQTIDAEDEGPEKLERKPRKAVWNIFQDVFGYQPEPDIQGVIQSYSRARESLADIADIVAKNTLGLLTGATAAAYSKAKGESGSEGFEKGQKGGENVMKFFTHEALRDVDTANPALVDAENSIRKKLGLKEYYVKGDDSQKKKASKSKPSKLMEDAGPALAPSSSSQTSGGSAPPLTIPTSPTGGTLPQGGTGFQLPGTTAKSGDINDDNVKQNLHLTTGPGLKKKKKSRKKKKINKSITEKYACDFKTYMKKIK